MRVYFLHLILLFGSLGWVPFAETQQPDSKGIPATGWAGPGLESLDLAVLDIMDRHGIPGASLAIAKDGKLVFAKGFGWAHPALNLATRPDTLFALASISKPITALARDFFATHLVRRRIAGLDRNHVLEVGHFELDGKSPHSFRSANDHVSTSWFELITSWPNGDTIGIAVW
jgi:hypothetical protein